MVMTSSWLVLLGQNIFSIKYFPPQMLTNEVIQNIHSLDEWQAAIRHSQGKGGANASPQNT